LCFTMPSRKIIMVNNTSLASNRVRRSVGEKNYSLWGGGSTTVVSPREESNGDIILAELQCVPSVVGAGVINIKEVKVAKEGGRKRKMVAEDSELMDPEEEEKRRVRRDRNRLAAAKCRQRRLDQIETLQVEVEAWEQRNKRLEQEMALLRAEKEEMAFVLAAHKTSCRLQTEEVASVEVKVEDPLMQPQPNQPEDQPGYIVPEDQHEFIIQVPAQPLKPARPASLSLAPRHIEGVTIETPSRQILSFDTLMEARTGLTPTVSLLSPLKSGLNTPTCGAQHKSSVVFTPLFSPNTEATLLHL